MSMRSLLLATKTGIQTMLGITGDSTKNAVVDITEEGQPKPVSGQVFYGIYGVSVSNSANLSMDEEYRLAVVITLRADYVPVNTVGTDLLTAATTGLWARAEALRAYLHMKESIRTDANTNAGYGCAIGGARNGFVQPLRYVNMEYLGAKGPEWFWCQGHDEAVTGVAVRVNFDFARRVQVIEEQS